jgi:hypothetical protein
MFGLCGSTLLQAQNTFQNAEISQDHDLQGSARYVAMGGAFSALGAEITAMTDNPAATALMRKSEVSITAGAIWGADESATDLYDRTHGTFDQGGIVGAFRIDGRYLKNFNIGFNYHKKINFNNLKAGETLCNGSQLNQFADLLNRFGSDISTESIYGAYYDCGLLDKTGSGENTRWSRSAQLTPTWGQGMYRMTTGGLHSYDINFSTNIKDRYYVGLTIGVDNMNYRRESSYTERIGSDANPLDYYIEDLQTIKGTGVNFKFGAIIRPVADNPLRLGVAIETPTWFLLTSRYDYTLYTKFITTEEDAKRYGQPKHTFVAKPDVYPTYCSGYYDMDYSLRTPWRFRLAVGSTVENWLAWGVDFEYAIYKYEGMGYPANDERRSIFNTTEDVDMNTNTRSCLSGQYRVKFGLEAKPIKRLAVRAGYNYISSIYKNEEWDPACADESTVNSIGTNWITVSPTHLITCGLGTRIKWFGIDLAYKCRLQHGYYFGSLDTYPSHIYMNLRRHTVVCTLSARF